MKNALFLAAALLLAFASFFAGKSYSERNGQTTASASKLKPLIDNLGVTTMATTYYAYCTPQDHVLNNEELVHILENNIALRDKLGSHLLAQNPEMSPESIAEFVLSAAFGLQRQTINSLGEDTCVDPKWLKMNDYLKNLSTQDLQADVPAADRATIPPQEVLPILRSIKNS